MSEIFLIAQTVLASCLTAGVTAYVALKKAKTEIHVAELDDRATFRQQLMTRIEELNCELKECQFKHDSANRRLARLEKILRDHNIELID